MCVIATIGLSVGRGALLLICPKMSRRMLSDFLDNVREIMSTYCQDYARRCRMKHIEALFTSIVVPQGKPETYSLWLEPVPIQVDAVKDD